MHNHQIILRSSYSTKRRICLHHTDCDADPFDLWVAKVAKAYDGKGVPFSVHSIMTDSADWDSVVKRDPYFGDVKVIDSVDEFIELTRMDRFLTGLDVAKYILSKGACTHTRLEKLTYMCYADYLCDCGKRLFTDDIYAFDHGPVVDTVYRTYNGHSRLHPGTPIIGIELNLDCGERDRMPILGRIMASEDGHEKVRSIERSFKSYADLATEDLVRLTHREHAPWNVTIEREDEGRYSVIKDPDIIELHTNEMP